MSNPLRGDLSGCGRSAYFWSYGSDVAASATPMAELYKGIAIVGVGPVLSCNGPNCGSAVVTTPGHAPKGCVPEPLFMIRLPTLPVVVTLPVKKHSFAPLFAMIVSWSVKAAE